MTNHWMMQQIAADHRRELLQQADSRRAPRPSLRRVRIRRAEPARIVGLPAGRPAVRPSDAPTAA